MSESYLLFIPVINCIKVTKIWSIFLLFLQSSPEREFFSGYTDSNRYRILEVVGKGSYGVVCSATDTQTGEKVAIKKIRDIFEHASDAARILREIKLLRMLRHPDIVEIKHIMLPPSKKEFKDIYVVFELMDTDLHQVIKANDDLTREHHQFFLYQMLRALKYIHTGKFLFLVLFIFVTVMCCWAFTMLGYLNCNGLILGTIHNCGACVLIATIGFAFLFYLSLCWILCCSFVLTELLFVCS